MKTLTRWWLYRVKHDIRLTFDFPAMSGQVSRITCVAEHCWADSADMDMAYVVRTTPAA